MVKVAAWSIVWILTACAALFLYGLTIVDPESLHNYKPFKPPV